MSQNSVVRCLLYETSRAKRQDSPMPDTPQAATEAFLAHRNLLFTAPYELLGSAVDAGMCGRPGAR